MAPFSFFFFFFQILVHHDYAVFSAEHRGSRELHTRGVKDTVLAGGRKLVDTGRGKRESLIV